MIRTLFVLLLVASFCSAEPEFPPEVRRLRGELEQATLHYEAIEELGREGAAGKLRALMDDTPGEELATDAMKLALAGRLAEQLTARAAGVESYLALVDASEPRWITPEDDDEWYHIECNEQMTISPTPGDRSDPRGSLAAIAAKRFEAIGTISGWSTGRDASAIVFHVAPDDHAMHLAGFELRPKALNDMAYIRGGGTALRAWRPPITGEELLERDGQALCADALLMVKWTNGDTSAIKTVWAWDPAGESWAFVTLGEIGMKSHGMCF